MGEPQRVQGGVKYVCHGHCGARVSDYYVCPHCGARWSKPPKRDRRRYDQPKGANKRRFGRANRRRVLAYKCCQAQQGVMR